MLPRVQARGGVTFRSKAVSRVSRMRGTATTSKASPAVISALQPHLHLVPFFRNNIQAGMHTVALSPHVPHAPFDFVAVRLVQLPLAVAQAAGGRAGNSLAAQQFSMPDPRIRR